VTLTAAVVQKNQKYSRFDQEKYYSCMLSLINEG
jgi:hypothetical protein